MHLETVTRWFILSADGFQVDGPYKFHRGALEEMKLQPGYRQHPGWYRVERQSYQIPVRAKVSGRRRNGWEIEHDELKAEWEATK